VLVLLLVLFVVVSFEVVTASQYSVPAGQVPVA
jgi:hypothetical protein